MPETYIVVDIETSGGLVGKHNILSIGACVAFHKSDRFYIEMKPMTPHYEKKAEEATGLSMKELAKSGEDPKAAMAKFERWAKKVSRGNVPVFVASPATFDWPYVNYYFINLLGRNPFDWGNVIEMRSYFAGKYGLSISEATRERLYETFRPKARHTHNALSDAVGYCECFEKLLRYKKPIA